jgi:FAD/FMN-containing dehydrogenase
MNSDSVNLRFTLEPVAVVFPSTPLELAEIVKIGKANHLRVTARSGGVGGRLSQGH